MAAVDGREGDEDEGYKFWKMLSKREAKGSSDGAGEGDAGEGGAAEGTEAGLSVRAKVGLLVGVLV